MSKVDIPLNRFIYALGIKEVGEATSKLLAKKFCSMENLMNASEDDLKSIKDVGPVAAKSVVMFMNDSRNIKILNELDKLGVWPQALAMDNTKKIFEDKTFVITGTLNKGREEYKKLIEDLGGIVKSSVSKKTSYFVISLKTASKSLFFSSREIISFLFSCDFIALQSNPHCSHPSCNSLISNIQIF